MLPMGVALQTHLESNVICVLPVVVVVVVVVS